MSEAQRFMRYVLPGMVSLLMFTIFYSIAFGVTLKDILNYFGDKSAATALSVIVGIFLTSGALGYLFSTIYFLLCQKCKHIGLDHRPAILSLINNKYAIDIFYADNNHSDKLNNKNISLQDALALNNAWWWYLQGHDSGVKSIDCYLLRLSDAIHSLGATIIGSIVGFLVLILEFLFSQNLIFIKDDIINLSFNRAYLIVIYPAIIGISLWNFYMLHEYLQRYANTVLIDAVNRHPEILPIYRSYQYIVDKK